MSAATAGKRQRRDSRKLLDPKPPSQHTMMFPKSWSGNAELLSDEEEELYEQVGVLFRTKSEKELSANNGSLNSTVSGNSSSSSSSAHAQQKRREAPVREIPFWNINHRKMVSLSLESDEVRSDLDTLCIEIAPQSQSADASLKGRLRSRTGPSDHRNRHLENGVEVNVSDLFTAHPERKGWVTCKQCGIAVWPPNCRKHITHCN
ncbi:hypothetical protein NDN08_006179 [Rhodosorus marinus]|uniref:Uncharacterized protein n=1 Tax=Rhodosorus marinus TaxID=101924 RepID=A0AAV8ULH0_9RHOD|nr:hypothetical protein NDN08_006179 [Rhodosorus marinus]